MRCSLRAGFIQGRRVMNKLEMSLIEKVSIIGFWIVVALFLASAIFKRMQSSECVNGWFEWDCRSSKAVIVCPKEKES